MSESKPEARKIVAKFACTQVTKFASGEEVTLMPVGGTPENKSWATATPGGCLRLNISNPAACDSIVPGREYILTVQEA